MSALEVVELDQSKAFMLPYAPAVRVAGPAEYLFLSGAVSADDDEYPDDIVEQVRLVMRRHTEVLEANGLGWNHVVHVFEFLTDMRDTVPVHITMGEFFTDSDWKPANTLIGVNALARAGARFELDVIAARATQTDAPPTAHWMSGATAIPLYHMHPHVEEECVLPDDIAEQTRRVLTTFDEVLAYTGAEWSDVRKASLFLTDLRDHEIVRAAVAAHLGGTRVAISLVGINALSAPGARLELEMMTGADSLSGVEPTAAAAGDGTRPAVLTGVGSGLVYLPAVSGPGTGIRSQLETTLDVVADRLADAGLGWRSVVKVLVHVVDARDAAEVTSAIQARCGDWVPAVTLIQADNLPVVGARVQLDVTAAG